MKQLNLKIFYLKKKVIFPYCTMSLVLRSTNNSKEIKKGDKILAYTVRTVFDLLFYRNRISTLSEILDVNSDEKGVKILLKGLLRVRIKKIIKFKFANFEILKQENTASFKLLSEKLRKKAQELIFLINVEESDKLIKLLNYIVDLNQMIDFIANYFVLNFIDRYTLYNETDIQKRITKLILMLDILINKMNNKREKTIL